ncbi:uncharacterized protein C2845_PM01G31300 [Panicum miliaceum]|uniref:Calponin-homology (CH) domain-containing protein n=1 Tax=Panicum miliaceum TaxID=4540 RepID=A0A3L6TJ67_PANMI|nr:uncharacterized protein C2845_PM01G31300 [Panicum miliaceum]
MTLEHAMSEYGGGNGTLPIPEFVAARGGKGIFRIPLRAAMHPGRPPPLEVRPHPLRETHAGSFLRTLAAEPQRHHLWAGAECEGAAISLHAARGGEHEDLSWSALGRRAPRGVMVGDRRGWGEEMRSRAPQGGPAGAVRVYEASCASTFRELDDTFLQKQTKIWLGEVLHLWFDETVLVADLLADGELLYQISKLIRKRLLKQNREQLTQSKVYIYERPSFGRSHGKYMPYLKVDSFLKICQILGLAGIDLFIPSDVVEKRNVRKVCICIRSVSKKSQMMRLNIIFGGQNDKHGDTNYDSDEAESKLDLDGKAKPPPQRPEDDAPKSGKGVLKSVARGITLVGAVFSMVHHLRCGSGTGRQRRSRGRHEGHRAPEQEGAGAMQRPAGSMAWELAADGVGLAVRSWVIWLFFIPFQLF